MPHHSTDERGSAVQGALCESLLKHLGVGVIALDARQVVVTWNDAVAALTGVEAKAALGQAFKTVAPALCDQLEINPSAPPTKTARSCGSRDRRVFNTDGRGSVTSRRTWTEAAGPDGCCCWRT
jgi:PAS domain-containing protein